MKQYPLSLRAFISLVLSPLSLLLRSCDEWTLGALLSPPGVNAYSMTGARPRLRRREFHSSLPYDGVNSQWYHLECYSVQPSSFTRKHPALVHQNYKTEIYRKAEINGALKAYHSLTI